MRGRRRASLRRSPSIPEMIALVIFGLAQISASVIGTSASPLARIHVRFIQPPHVQEHGFVTDDGRIVSQQSYLSIGSKSWQPSLGFGGSPEWSGFSSGFASSGFDSTGFDSSGYHYPASSYQSIYIPPRVTYTPFQNNDIQYGSREIPHQTPDFSNGLDYPDPLLLTGAAAMQAVRYLYGNGELFFHNIPHVRALLRNQEERRKNGLNGNILSSLRPESAWYRSRVN